jgi:endonuclease/exonuclease/phosphatase family metal-dependent hydrolase
MPPSLSVASINIEMSKHLDRICAFLSQRKPDIVCLQELCDRDVARFSASLGGATPFFVPMSERLDAKATTGVGIFSLLPIETPRALYYRGSPAGVPQFDLTSAYTKSQTQNHLIAACEVLKENTIFKISTTHFTWTPDGTADDIQRHDLQALLECLNTLDQFVLCGDFNFPRGGELFTIMASLFKDNIPTRYTTSIDPILHRAGPLELMVDGVFSTTYYSVSNVELHSGVSDHCAVTFDITESL